MRQEIARLREQQQATQESSLLDRWKKFEVDEDEVVDDKKFRQEKEDWFMEAFSFLNHLPTTSHCWCQHQALSIHLLEPFFSFIKNTSPDCAIQVLWRRFTSEFQACINCISIYYQAKRLFQDDYESSVVTPILAVLGGLDRKRVAESMQLVCKPGTSINVMCVVFEIFRYPELLEDPGVDKALVPFFSYIADVHDLQLSEHQRYPGLYALLSHSVAFLRFMVYRLATPLKPFSFYAEDLEEVQSVLEKRMKYLETGQKARIEANRLRVAASSPAHFLLQQVPHSSNFSSFIRKYAPQTAFNIVLRSYKLDPASPPFECLHFLGPTLLSVTMNTKLPPSLRQPAIELTEMILVAAVLVALYPETWGLENGGVEELSGFSWDSFVQKIERDCESWHCTPLVEALQSSLPNSSSFIRAAELGGHWL